MCYLCVMECGRTNQLTLLHLKEELAHKINQIARWRSRSREVGAGHKRGRARYRKFVSMRLQINGGYIQTFKTPSTVFPYT